MVIERSNHVLQSIIDQSPCAEHYYSDGYMLSEAGIYGAHYTSCYDKSHSFAVKADNVELRHFLARLARESRCFLRFLHALRYAIHLSVWAWNRRQLHKCRCARYPAHLRDFVSVPICSLPKIPAPRPGRLS